MAKRSVSERIFGGWRKWALGGLAAVVVVLLFVSAIWGERIRMWWVLRDLRESPEATVREVHRLGRPYREALEASILAGGRAFGEELTLFDVAFRAPFYLSDELRDALGSDDETVRRAAIVAYLDWDRNPQAPPHPVSDDVMEALRRWARPENAGSVYLGAAISRLEGYEDDRIPGVVVPVLLATTKSDELAEVGRSNDARVRAAKLLAAWPDDPDAVAALTEVVKRDPNGESNWVQTYAWQSLAAGGYAKDPEIYWIAARSPDKLTRQMVANNLEHVKNKAVVPILESLLGDPVQVVRRGAVDSLFAKRAPILMKDLLDLAEDSYSPIRGDLAEAVRFYREKRYLPFLGWCLTDTDPQVVRKAIEALDALAGDSYAFTLDQWRSYQYSGMRDRLDMVQDFMNDEDRKEAAVNRLAEEHPPRYTDEDRIPHLIRMLGHADVDNVQRAMRLLAEITGRKEGFAEAILDPGAKADAEADALYRFMNGDGVREKVIADWKRWYAGREK